MEEMICLTEEPRLKLRWKTERVRKDASGDRELDGEEDDDELPCVIGESEGDCVWRGSRRSFLGVRSIDKVKHTEKSD